MAEGNPLSFDVGHKVTFTKTVTDDDIQNFAKASGDDQRVHLDGDYAAQTRFKKRIAHGILSAGVISAAIGTKLPGPNESAIYLSQNCQFRAPVSIGDTVTATIEVTEVNYERRRVKLNTTVTNQDGTVVVMGDAQVLIDAFPFAG